MFNKSYRKQISSYGPLCPYCGYHDLDFMNVNECVDDDRDIVGCFQCGQNFEYRVSISSTFTTKKIEEME